jgi:hypothetical protein
MQQLIDNGKLPGAVNLLEKASEGLEWLMGTSTPQMLSCQQIEKWNS